MNRFIIFISKEKCSMSVAKRPRIADVAKLAGVSEGTVSVVLNNRVGEHVRVSEETQRKIWGVVRELGYVANPIAQSLAGGQNHILAVFTFEPIFPIDSRNFYYPFLVGIEQEADLYGYDILLVTGANGSNNGIRHIYRDGINRLRRADGAILLGHGERGEIGQLLQERYPFVFVGRRESVEGNISYVAADYRAATVEIVQYLMGCGHQHIVYLSSTRHTEASQDRDAGIREALGHREAPNGVWRGDPSQLEAATVSEYLAQGYTAFVAEDDELGHQLLTVAQSLGLHCPDDFSMAVLGNPLSPLIEVPDWMSFSIPRREMGQAALKMLIDLLKQPVEERSSAQRQTLRCTFKAGNSVRQR